MTTDKTPRGPHRRTVALSAAALVLTTLATTGSVATAGAGASAPTRRAPQSRDVATSVLGTDYKVTLTALRSTSDKYAATVRLRVFVRDGGAWKESDHITVGKADGWFWFPLTGRHAVREFATASTEPAPVDVSLLVTPSIGYSDTFHYLISHGDVTPR
ncbi:hypothetical protein [Streptomyces sp. H51]|uniref:hypothetical protein n=1 Tax=Streptomyces sp. H51 TaxID=3111770 RepID=UPI002D7A01C8|nr:hypothetical protein [Streptomyces sp. H51]